MGKFSEAAFKNPPSEYRFAPFWFLNHELNTEETVWQVQEMHRKGVDGFILHARHGLITPYMSGEFLDQIQAAVEEGERLGMKAYLYDENNYPSGAANGEVVKGHPEFAKSQVYLAEEFDVGAGGMERSLAERPLAVIAVPEDKRGFPETSQNLNSFVNDGILRWKPSSGKWRVYVFVRRFDASYHFSGEVPDLMNKQAMKRFIELTHKKYAERLGEHFGRTILGIFTDEPYLTNGPYDGAPWTEGMAEEFNWRCGYDLLTALPALFRDMGEQTAKIRCDFWDTTTELYVQAFFKQIYDYCDPLRLASVGHVLYEGEMLAHARMQGDFFRGAKYMHYGGVDQLFELTWWKPGVDANNLLGPKFASSAAHLFQKPVVMSECFGLASQWGISLRSLKWMADWEILMGVNLLEPHAFYYSIQGFRKWECPPGEFYQSPFWPYYRQFADYCARLCYLFRGGRHVADAALLYPIKSLWAAMSPGGSEGTAKVAESLNQVSRALLRANVDFDILPEESLETADFGKGTILARNEAGEALEEYRLLVIPEVSLLKTDTIPLLVEYLEKGGRALVAGGLPERLWGEVKQGYPAAVLREALEGANGRVAFLNPAPNWDASAWEQNVRKGVESLIEPDVTVRHKGKPVGDIIHLHHLRDGKHLLLVSNTSRSETYEAQISVAATGIPRLWDALTGQVWAFETFEVVGERTVLRVEFAPQQSYVISLEPEQGAKPALAFEGDVELLEAVTRDSVHVATRQQGMIRGTLRVGDESRAVSARQGGAPLKPLVLGRRWEFRTEKANALPLTDWEYRMEAAVHGRDRASGWHTYSCRFNCAVKPKQARLLVDGLVIEKVWGRTTPVYAKFHLNAKAIETFEEGGYLDHFILEADVSEAIKRGQNLLTIETQGHAHEIPSLSYPPMLVGDFSVERPVVQTVRLSSRQAFRSAQAELKPRATPATEEDAWVLRSQKPTIGTGDWSEQGYPFYSGIGTYSQQVEIPASFVGKRLMLELEGVGDLAEIIVNQRKVAVLAWDPFRVDIGSYVRRGRNEITLKVANSLQNLLCLQPKPSGILGEVRIVPYHRVTLK